MSLEPFKTYRARVTIRPTWKGCATKPGAHLINGEEHDFRVMWKCHEGELYDGEYILEPADETTRERYGKLSLAWIAEGDLTFIPSVTAQ